MTTPTHPEVPSTKRSRIVVPVDPTRQPTAAVAVAGAIARQADLAVEIVAAGPGGAGIDAHLFERSREAERAGAPETSWRGLGAGDAADLVCESLLPDDVALVCLATRSRGAVGELLLGSVADAVVRRSPVPVLLVGPDVEPVERYRRLVVALDGSELAERAGAVAVELAERTATDVALLEVIADEPVPADVAETAYLARYAAGLPDPPGRYDVVRSDRPGQAILDATAGADDVVVVMGTHGRTALRRLVMGSVAHHVVQRATAPVLVVPPTTTG
ncbi:MAG: universal stress protein [Actinomycetota bacterium]